MPENSLPASKHRASTRSVPAAYPGKTVAGRENVTPSRHPVPQGVGRRFDDFLVRTRIQRVAVDIADQVDFIPANQTPFAELFQWTL